MYSFDSRVKYSETDKDGFLSMEGIMNYFQDCSALHSEDMSVGIDFQRANHVTWMIVSWHVQILKRPKYAEKITIGTWPYSFRGIKGGRNFVLLDENGETLVKADSEWVLIDTEKNRITKIPEMISSAYELEDAYEMGEIRKRVTTEELVENCGSITVTPFFLDTNGHVNNVKYLSVAADYIAAPYDEFRVEYRSQAFLHDEICVYRVKKETGCKMILKNQKDEILVNLEFEKMVE